MSPPVERTETPDDRLASRLTGEFVGTALLLLAVVGSGIMAEGLSQDPGLRLLQNAIATAGALVALILAFGGVSGAHFNPAVTLVERASGAIGARMALFYIVAQTAGAVGGVVLANLLFDLEPVTWSTTDRSAGHLALAEIVATVGLLLVIVLTVRRGQAELVPFAVGGYIAGAYYFTSSTSFANPAVTIGRMFSDTFAGIAPGSAPRFVAAQLVGTGVAISLIRVMAPAEPPARTR